MKLWHAERVRCARMPGLVDAQSDHREKKFGGTTLNPSRRF